MSNQARSAEAVQLQASPRPIDLVVGVGGVERNSCVALSAADKILGVCEQERITRVRAAGVNPSGLPDEALDELLRRANRQKSDIGRYAVAESLQPQGPREVVRLEYHFTHACSAFLPSPFSAASVIVCDPDSSQLSVWEGKGSDITAVESSWTGPAFAEIYSQCARVLGFDDVGGAQKLEALARLDPNYRDIEIDRLFTLQKDRLECAPDWKVRVEGLAAGGWQQKIAAAAGVQSRLADLLVDFVRGVMQRRPGPLCLGGSLFLNSYFNARIKQCGVADDVFVPVNPGKAGLSVGAALHLRGGQRESVSPFLGPLYESEEIKTTLDNCKLKYDWVPPADVLDMAVEDLLKGELVGWFDGPMEWGPRSLGGRSILASPFSPYVLDNLNRFLKHRDSWRGYALSGLEAAVHEHFHGPSASHFMECDYTPNDPEAFGCVLPQPTAGVRIQTVGQGAPSLFRDLLAAFGRKTGCPILVNTSFNGFREPIVCSPRDAVRVFYGTGIDTLVLRKFILRKS
jgi:carbamoyltransferase